ncbi:VOC family protein [Paenibacillus qinlingensis]|uniref:Catechol 2,3-dioxygenase-like lactoylglutathione lyase family enzyme n=1 Tax=Paenibacillus qinlingensis TaxID=1837343 RepID=A0ABU1NS62_9BACL|nr:VOC family protein [Paenibacillus qinlingensis]MDR6550289.1 catechol 2,3-dioxygenase-like lactoylglutathione lyase family enzyme [Paenibacillus qinlingensis]
MNPVKNQIGGVFIPVSNIENARDWYCDILGLPTDGELFFGHIYILPMEGPNIVLDSKIYSPENVYQVPSFQFRTEDIQQAYEFMRAKNVQLTTGIENDHWFNFRDPDGNLLMVCK